MRDEALESLLNDIESDRVERKESMSDGDKIRQAICAFANDLPDHRQPGVLFVGVNDKGEPAGLSITDQLLQNLASMRQDGNILPFPSLTVQKRNLKGRDVAVVLVQPSDAPPVRFKGTIWVRVGPRRAIATSDDERRLNEKRRHKDIPPDIRPFPSASIETLDELLFRRLYLPTAVSRETIDQNQRDFEHQLIAAKFAYPGHEETCATLLGLLTIGKSPTDWIPGAYVQFLRIDGTVFGDPIQAAQDIRSPLPDLMHEMETLFKTNIRTAMDITSGSMRIQTPDYPLAALQQIARNAILHRSYENTNAPVHIYWFQDRVEIHNPGGPYGNVTKENFGQPGAYDYRNPNLAAVLKELGYVEQFGYGIITARKAMKENGNPLPEFQIQDAHIAVILRSRP